MVPKAIPIVVGVVGLVLILLSSILGWVVLPKVIDDKIEEEVRLVEGSETWDKWKDITLPIQMKFYIFAVQNGDQVKNNKSAPMLVQKGPYIFNEKREKEILDISGDNITYRQPIMYIFNEDDSAEDYNEEIDIINVAFVSVMHGVEEQVKVEVDNIPLPPSLIWLKPILTKIATSIVLTEVSRQLTSGHCNGTNAQSAIRRIKPLELFFDGFDVSCYFELPLLKDNLASQPEFTDKRFGLYRANNNSDEGNFTIHSGISDSSQFGTILRWSDSKDDKGDRTTLGYWNKDPNNAYCDMINGTDGSIYPPFVDKILRVFVTDLCRSLYLTYNSKTEFLGIKGYRFTVPREMLEDPRVNQDNRCFCLEEYLENCPGGGALDVATCRGAPIVMSAPYFLDGDVRYSRAILGDFVADREAHQTVMDVEPNSGVLMQAIKRLQVNLHVRNFTEYSNNTAFANVKETSAFPLIWVEEYASLDQENADDLKDKLLKPLKIINVSKWTVLGLGILTTIGGVAWFVLNK